MCLACRAAGRPPSPLELGPVARRDGDDVIEGVLVCSTRSCQRECPIIDGIPIIVPDVAQFIRDHEGPLLARDDLSALTLSLFSDCLDTDSSFGTNQSVLSSYAQGHYEAEGGLAPLLDVVMPLLTEPPSGVWLDTGCATGGATFALAARGADLAVGIDLNLTMLRFARRLVTEGRATYQRRKAGVVHEERTVEVDDAHRDRIELWAASATALPFYDGSIAGALSLNVVDSVDVPVFHLAEMGRVLEDGAEALICSPYDWATRVTELPRWIGGHSPRSTTEGSPANEMRRLLSDESPPEMNIRLRLVRERESVPWRVYLNERATIEYRAHVMVARTQG